MRKAHECGVYKIRKAPSEQEEAGFSNQKAVKVCYAVFYTNKPNFVTQAAGILSVLIAFCPLNHCVNIL